MKKNKSKNNIKSLGPYSQTRIFNNSLFMSGQIGINPNSGKLVSNKFDDQLKQILQNIAMILEESGSSYTKIIKLTVFVTDLSKFDNLNSIFLEFNKQNKVDVAPVRTTVQVSQLPKGATIEIDLIAEL